MTQDQVFEVLAQGWTSRLDLSDNIFLGNCIRHFLENVQRLIGDLLENFGHPLLIRGRLQSA